MNQREEQSFILVACWGRGGGGGLSFQNYRLREKVICDGEEFKHKEIWQNLGLSLRTDS